MSTPSALMVAAAPGINGGDDPKNPKYQRLAYDPQSQISADAA